MDKPRGGGQMARSVTVTTFRSHALYPRISRAVETLLRKDKIVRPVDVLVEMRRLKRKHLEDWRCGRVPYLERVIDCNLSRLSTLLWIRRRPMTTFTDIGVDKVGQVGTIEIRRPPPGTNGAGVRNALSG
jgi:hypothetical protein